MSRLRRSTDPRGAFTLVEVLVVLGLLSILMTVVFFTLSGALRLNRAADADYDRANSLTDLAEQFRADVAASRDLPGQLGSHKATEATLPLLPVETGPIVYHWDGLKLTRIRLPVGDKPAYPEIMALPDRVRTVRFERIDGPQRSLVRLVVQSGRGPVVYENLDRHEIVAAVGADVR